MFELVDGVEACAEFVGRQKVGILSNELFEGGDFEGNGVEVGFESRVGFLTDPRELGVDGKLGLGELRKEGLSGLKGGRGNGVQLRFFGEACLVAIG